MEKEVYTPEDLEKIRQKANKEKKISCWKTGKACELNEAEMYNHDGGVKLKDVPEKQWVYFVCRNCDYQWALHKILSRLKLPHTY